MQTAPKTPELVATPSPVTQPIKMSPARGCERHQRDADGPSSPLKLLESHGKPQIQSHWTNWKLEIWGVTFRSFSNIKMHSNKFILSNIFCLKTSTFRHFPHPENSGVLFDSDVQGGWKPTMPRSLHWTRTHPSSHVRPAARRICRDVPPIGWRVAWAASSPRMARASLEKN